MNRRCKGLPLIALGALFLLSALGLVGYNLWDGQRAAETAGRAAEALAARILEAPADPAETVPAVRIDGDDYMGLLEIPSLGLTLPVMAHWDNAQLRKSPCRFSGSCQGRDLVICGHNYRRHFGPIRHADIGADVYLTTADSRVHRYVVVDREILASTAVEQMVDRARGDWDLTLFTCTLGGQTRCAVRCDLADDDG